MSRHRYFDETVTGLGFGLVNTTAQSRSSCGSHVGMCLFCSRFCSQMNLILEDFDIAEPNDFFLEQLEDSDIAEPNDFSLEQPFLDNNKVPDGTQRESRGKRMSMIAIVTLFGQTIKVRVLHCIARDLATCLSYIFIYAFIFSGPSQGKNIRSVGPKISTTTEGKRNTE